MSRWLIAMTAAWTLGGNLAGAESPAASALSWSATDATLQWGPCPDFLPDGCQIAVLHGDPGQPNADVFFKVPPGATLPKHSHASAERMVLVSGELQVTYDGQKPFTMKTGAYAYGPAGAPHSGVCLSKVPCILFIAFEAPVDATSLK